MEDAFTERFADDTLRSGVATTYSVAAGASLVVVALWLAASLAHHRWLDVAGSGFFETAAQLLPVLLLTFAVERVFFERPTAQLTSRATSIAAFLTVFFLTAIGEMLSIIAIAWNHGPPHAVRVLGGMCVTAGTAGSLTLIVGFAAVRSGVVLDLRAGLRILIRGAPDDFDPRASVAAQAAAFLLACCGIGLGVGGIAVAVGFASTESYGETDFAVGVIIFAAIVAFVLAAPSVLHLRRVIRRTRQRRTWRRELPDSARRFEQLTADEVNALPSAARRVMLGCYHRLVDEHVPLLDWPARLIGTGDDERLSLSERAAIKGLADPLTQAAAMVNRELEEAASKSIGET